MGLYPARSVPPRGKAPGWSCPGATPTRASAPQRSVPKRSRRPCGADRYQAGLALDAQAGDHRQHLTVLDAPPRSAELPGECLAIHDGTTGCRTGSSNPTKTWSRCAPSLEHLLIDQPCKVIMSPACANGRMGSDRGGSDQLVNEATANRPGIRAPRTPRHGNARSFSSPAPFPFAGSRIALNEI